MEIQWNGTASVSIRHEGEQLLFDPFVPLRGADYHVQLSCYQDCPTIFLTHGHFDHIANIPEIVRLNPDVTVCCTDTPKHTLLNRGVPEKNLRLIHYGDTIIVGGFTVRVFHGRHAILPRVSPGLLRRILFNRHVGNLPHILREHRLSPENDESLFYEITAGGRTVSLMGSLNLREDVDYPTGSDLLLLPYNGWDDCLPPASAAIKRLKPKHVLLDHYDNAFPPLTSPIDRTPILQKYDFVEEAKFGEVYIL